ncbi:cyclin G [Lepeophtheirus salmonis]|uniref:cyclin G n=1 Tax=Lepeophtheirus salmonis TaxID=72036 RepID=UPI001AE87569|nr:cyclin G-like [Lepeophtheirus salmonis]XP_040569884.1 cyclin G-like [Lepeophtheirus salmonis]XP_040569885.1 cyclin G-like [Lepeophtheirus salmonis]XP_040569886.1 cyclin G-like [Lepeophtheirus salmonis]
MAAAEEIYPYLKRLDHALQLEVKYKGGIQPSCSSNCSGTITCGMRDGSSHVLRCLKVWYDLPSDIFFNAICSIDRFLSKMKAQPKHLSCIAVSAFHLACRQYMQLHQPHKVITIPEPSDLVSISQSRCSPSDLLRMQAILSNKLELNPVAGPEQPITSLEFLRLMVSVCRAATFKLGLQDKLQIPDSIPDNLLHQLEILACDSVTLQFRPSEVALALLASEFQSRTDVSDRHISTLMGFIAELQKYCNISSGNFVNCLNVVMELLNKYNGEGTVTHRQRLVWKLSNRTLRHLRPTDKLRPTLPTIKESGQANVQRRRSSSESSDEFLEPYSDSDQEMEVEGWSVET